MPKVKKLKSIESPYIASIKVYGKTYQAVGTTVSDALSKLEFKGLIRGMTILTIQKGDQKKDRVLHVLQTQRLFSPSRITREIALKNVSSLFNL